MDPLCLSNVVIHVTKAFVQFLDLSFLNATLLIQMITFKVDQLLDFSKQLSTSIKEYLYLV